MTRADALAVACDEIGRALGMIMQARGAISGMPDETPLPLLIQEIARNAYVRCRQVALENDWHRHDCGPILGFRLDGMPVALIPLSSDAYALHDPKTGARTPVDARTVKEMETYGYIFYPPFPEGRLGLMDLGRVCVRRDLHTDALKAFVYSILAGVCSLSMPLVLLVLSRAHLPGSGLFEAGPHPQTWWWLFPALFAILSVIGVLYARSLHLAAGRWLNRQALSFQAAVWDRLLRLPMAFFRSQVPEALMESAIGPERIRNVISQWLPRFLLASSICTFNLLFLALFHLPLALAVLGLSVIWLMLGRKCACLEDFYYEKSIRQRRHIAAISAPLLAALGQLRTAGAEGRAFSQWKNAFRPYTLLQTRQHCHAATPGALRAAFPLASLALLIGIVSAKPLPHGDLLPLMAAYILFVIYFQQVAVLPEMASRVASEYDSLEPLMETLPEYRSGQVNPGRIRGTVQFCGVSFGYDDKGPDVLSNLDLTIDAGEWVGITGASGIGKSTLLRLLLGLETPRQGTIRMDGMALADMDLRRLRMQAGVVLQGSGIVSGTILQNICGFRPRLTIDHAWEAARRAGIDAFIQGLPMKMHTLISEGAGTLSAGHKQQILIARALAGDPRLLILDEATSALDDEAEEIVMNSLQRMPITRILIAHRASAIRYCSRIIVIDQGYITEKGGFPEWQAIAASLPDGLPVRP